MKLASPEGEGPAVIGSRESLVARGSRESLVVRESRKAIVNPARAARATIVAAAAAEAVAVAIAVADGPIEGVEAVVLVVPVARAAAVAVEVMVPARGKVAVEAAAAVEARGSRAPRGSKPAVPVRQRRERSRSRSVVEPLRLALVVQRYGDDVNGGAEYHCRLIAEHLGKQHRVEVLTSCAKDYITWRNEHPPGVSKVNGIPVRRFKVKRPRDPDRFGRLSQKVLFGRHDEKDEIAWLEEQGPWSPALLKYVTKHQADYDYFIFFSYRYYHSYYGVAKVAPKAVLVPTAEKDEVIELDIFKNMFHLPRAIVYNSIEERAMIWSTTGNHKVKGDVVGVGSDVPEVKDSALFEASHGVSAPYMIYVGRVDQNKGCQTLFQFFGRYREETGSDLRLVLVGGKKMEIPDDPAIYYAGFVSDAEKWSAIAGASLLVIPSELESLSMVTLEAWAAGKPVLANGKCDVLKGQCRRSNAGLYFEDYYEFREALLQLESDPELRSGLGRNGRKYFDEHYRWDVLEAKYNRLLEGLRVEDQSRPQPSPPGLLARWFGA